ncbi:MAG: hypothetical protein R2708_28365 [Vicinamibacterales bacterium]
MDEPEPDHRATFQIHRGKFERDLLQMNAASGAEIIRARVSDLELAAGGAAHRVVIQENGGVTRELRARHLVDAGGRKFLIGKKTDNVVRGPEHHLGLNNGASWVRVKGVDRTRFHDGYDPLNAVASHYYGTNHFLGAGHWIWMIPIDMDTDEISVGVMHHHDVIPGHSINSQEKLYAFFKANHRVLYDLLMTGELVDFHYFGRPGHSSKRLFSADNWYVIGDAAYIFDAFYSLGTSGISLAVESVTEIIKAKLAGDPDAEEKREAFDAFNRFFMNNMVHTYRDHARQLGHASAMSWRIFYEYMLWYGCLVPLYVGKWHLDPTFIRRLLRWNPIPFTAGVYDDLNTIVDTGRNVGFMDCHRGDQMEPGYTTWRAFDDYLENAKYEPQDVNIYRSVAMCYRRSLRYYAKLRWRAFGIAALAPGPVLRSLKLLGVSLGMNLLAYRHARARQAKRAATAGGGAAGAVCRLPLSGTLQTWTISGRRGRPAPASSARSRLMRRSSRCRSARPPGWRRRRSTTRARARPCRRDRRPDERPLRSRGPAGDGGRRQRRLRGAAGAADDGQPPPQRPCQRGRRPGRHRRVASGQATVVLVAMSATSAAYYVALILWMAAPGLLGAPLAQPSGLLWALGTACAVAGLGLMGWSLRGVPFVALARRNRTGPCADDPRSRSDASAIPSTRRSRCSTRARSC